jgi:N-acetylmuramoyl-L-alanine amidase
MKVTKQIVSDLSNTYGTGNRCDYITIHETANTSHGADAEAHADLQSGGNARDASWHYSVDDHSAYQSFGDDIQCWHAGDGQGTGNLHSIAIEICVNSDGDYAKACQNAASLTADLLAKHGLPLSKVVQHNKWSGKDCPNWLRENSHGVSWSEFIDMVAAAAAPEPKETDVELSERVDLTDGMRQMSGWSADSITVEATLGYLVSGMWGTARELDGLRPVITGLADDVARLLANQEKLLAALGGLNREDTDATRDT